MKPAIIILAYVAFVVLLAGSLLPYVSVRWAILGFYSGVVTLTLAVLWLIATHRR